MKLPKLFRPKKSLEEKTKELIKGNDINYENLNPKIKKALKTIDFSRGVLYYNLKSNLFEKSNLPSKKLVYASIYCSSSQSPMNYTFSYGLPNLEWLEIKSNFFTGGYLQLQDVITDVIDYYNVRYDIQKNHKNLRRSGPQTYLMKLRKSQNKDDLIKAIDNFYSVRFSISEPFFNKIIYKDLTKKEFINSKIPIKYVNVEWKNHECIGF